MSSRWEKFEVLSSIRYKGAQPVKRRVLMTVILKKDINLTCYRAQ